MMKKSQHGFTLVEMLITIAIIAILAGLVISMVANAAADTRLAVARQQQAALQEALHAWVSAYSSVAGAKANYTTTNTTAKAKLDNLLKNYLQKDTYDEFASNSTADQIKSSAMIKANVYLRFSSWSAASDYPTVEMVR